MSISFAHNNDSKASVASGNAQRAPGSENLVPGQAAAAVDEKNVQELEDAIRKRCVGLSAAQL